LEALGLGHLTAIEGLAATAAPGTAHGRATEVSAGKDTTTGHWEMMGLRLTEPFPLYPDGFPPEVVEPFERAIGREILGNRPASGTVILDELGQEHLRTGRPIVYTSGDSVFQVATHVDVVPLEQLYGWCAAARAVLTGKHAVGRVIARPFQGTPGAFERRPERRDLSLPPPSPTALQLLQGEGIAVHAIGKIADVFDGAGITTSTYTRSNAHGLAETISALGKPGPGLVFANLVDFDSKYGHRNDVRGYAEAVESFDAGLPELLGALDGAPLIITGDHGCDPTTPSTDHSRERTPILVAGLHGEPVDVGTRETFADIGATILELFGVDQGGLEGSSFAQQLRTSSRG
jgi:phosphopentomutase